MNQTSSDPPVPRSRRSSTRSVRSVLSTASTPRPVGWRPGGQSLAALPLASVSVVPAMGSSSSASGSSSKGKGSGSSSRGGAAAVATRAIQAAAGGAEASRRRALSVGDDVEDDSARPLHRRPSAASLDTQPSATATIVQPSAASSKSWLTSLTRAKGKQAMRSSSPPTSAPISISPPVLHVHPPTPSLEQDPIILGTLSTSPLGPGPSFQAEELHTDMPVARVIQAAGGGSDMTRRRRLSMGIESELNDGRATPEPAPLPSTSPPPPSMPPIPVAAPKRSWFSSPMRTVPSSPISSSNPRPLPDSTPSSPAAIAASSLASILPDRPKTPPPLPKTPPPTYPLELQLAVDSVVDADAMRLPTLAPASAGAGAEGGGDGDGEETDEMPPVYAAAEQTTREGGAQAVVGRTVESKNRDPSNVLTTNPSAEAPNQQTTNSQSDVTPQPESQSAPSNTDNTLVLPPIPPSMASTSSTVPVSASWWDYVGWGLSMSGSTLGSAVASSPTNNAAEEAEAAKVAQESEARVAQEAEAREAQETEAREAERVEAERQRKEEEEETAKRREEEERAARAAEEIQRANSDLGAWLSPWAWYYSNTSVASQTSSTDIAEEATAPESVIEQGQQVETSASVTTPPLPAERIADPLPEPAPVPASSPEPINPILASMSTHTSGWVSFFSSHSLVGRTLGYGLGTQRAVEDVKRDDTGAEVMEVDFDEDGDRQVSGDADRGRGADTKDVGGGDVVLRPAARSALVESPLPTSTRDPSPRPRVVSSAKAPPIKISDEVKKDSARMKLGVAGGSGSRSSSRASSAASTPVRGRSPAPSIMDRARTTSSAALSTIAVNNTTSTVSATSTSTNASATSTTTATTTTTSATIASTISRPASPLPAKKPAPPNLVLPTWADTFGVPPRSVPPPPKPKSNRQRPNSTHAGTSAQPQGGVLGKTLKFVNNVLFAKDGFGVPVMGAHAPSAATLTSATDLSGTRKGKATERPLRGTAGLMQRTFSSGSSASTSSDAEDKEKEKLSLVEQDRRARFALWGRELPKAWSVVDGTPAAGGEHTGESNTYDGELQNVLRGCRRVVVIGVHGWFPGAMIRSVLGEPTGTSTKFANMMEQALLAFEAANGVKFEKITKVPLEGDGTIARRVDKLYANLQANEEWMHDLHHADAVLVATHSQGCVVSTHLLERLIKDGHVVSRPSVRQDSERNVAPINAASAAATAADSASGMDAGGGMAALALSMSTETNAARKVQRVCMLALCGIHLGPLRYLSSSTLVGPYLQYFESTAARELFEFQNTESAVSKAYVASLNTVLDHGIKIVYVASLNDQVVPIYSGLFTAVSHPLILRALYIDGDAYHSSDFLSNLLVLLLRVLNAGMSDSGLLAHLSEATAGSLNGVGHSTAYEEVATYSLAVQYLFLANEGVTEDAKLEVESFNAALEQNDYEIPWSLRDVIADERVAYFFGQEIAGLRDAFREWHPKTTILRDLKRKLQPIQRLPSTFSVGPGTSKL